MTTLVLLRHAMCDAVGTRIAGRLPGVPLNECGRAQARRLAERFRGHAIAAIRTSPLERARETALAIGLQVERDPCELAALQEIDYGAWTGCTIDELRGDSRWHDWNEHRAFARVPGGECMLEVQARAVAALEELAVRHDGDTVVAVSHGDVIKAVLVHYAGSSLGDLARVEIAPASVSIIVMNGAARQIVRVNDTGALLD